MKPLQRNADQMAKTLVLFGLSFGPTAIHSKLCEEFQEPVTLKTVKNWLADFRRTPKDIDGRETAIAKFLERFASFTWGDIGQYEIPWEASEFIARLLVENVDSSISKGTWYRDLTRIEVSWIYRFHLVAPTVQPSTFLEMRDQIVLEDALSVLTGNPVDFDATFWYLAYRPSESPERQRAYDSAVDKRYIPPYDLSLYYNKALEMLQEASSLDPRSDFFDVAEGTAEQVKRDLDAKAPEMLQETSSLDPRSDFFGVAEGTGEQVECDLDAEALEMPQET